MEIELILPYPMALSVNNIWLHSKRGTYLNPKVAAYRKEVWSICACKGKFYNEDIRIDVKMFPTRKSCDIDNILKTILDALQYANIYDNDNQVKLLTVERFEPVVGGRIEVKLSSSCFKNE